MSRSVIMPTSRIEFWSSTTGTAPTSESRMICAARVRLSSRVTHSGFDVMISRAFIFPPLELPLPTAPNGAETPLGGASDMPAGVARGVPTGPVASLEQGRGQMPQQKQPITDRPKVEDESTGNGSEFHGTHQQR